MALSSLNTPLADHLFFFNLRNPNPNSSLFVPIQRNLRPYTAKISPFQCVSDDWNSTPLLAAAPPRRPPEGLLIGHRVWVQIVSSAILFIEIVFFTKLGQILDSIQSKSDGNGWRDRQLRKITDKVFAHFQDDTGKVNMTFTDLYIAVLLVYNDINKHLPGTHIDPPSKAQIKSLVEKYDINYDGELNRDEFAGVLKKLTADTFSVVSQRLVISLIAAPTVALLTKRATEGVPGIGKVVQKLPRSVYASLFTLAVVLIQKSQDRFE